MSDAISVSGPINAAGLEMTLETGKLASLAAGAVVVKVGGTTLLSTVATSKPREGIDFFPLTVDVEERVYAAGKIPGSFFRREGRPGELAILTCRLTDRPLRPSFPADFRNEVQVIATILGVDLENPHDVASINGASAALTVSGIPFDGPIGAVRLAHHNGEWIAHPTFQEGDESTFEIVVAGRQLDDGDVAIMMVEAGGTERTWELYEEGAPKMTEELIARGPRRVEAVDLGVDRAAEASCATSSIKARGPITPIEYMPNVDYTPDVYAAVKAHAEADTDAAMKIADKTDRNNKLDEILVGIAGRADRHRRQARRRTPSRRVRSRRPSARCRRKSSAAASSTKACASTVAGPADIRPLSAEVGVLDTAHGSGLFQRGETQVLVGRDARHAAHGADARHDHARRRASGTCTTTTSRRSPRARPGRVGSPKRREIGHGALAERALVPVLPTQHRVAVHDAGRLRRARVERLHVDGVGLRLDALADGRGCADQGAGRRHRDGPRVRRGQVHDPHRHPRSGRRVRRHGLQGRRHVGVRHRAAARHEDRRHPGRRARGRRCCRRRTPA